MIHGPLVSTSLTSRSLPCLRIWLLMTNYTIPQEYLMLHVTTVVTLSLIKFDAFSSFLHVPYRKPQVISINHSGLMFNTQSFNVSYSDISLVYLVGLVLYVVWCGSNNRVEKSTKTTKIKEEVAKLFLNKISHKSYLKVS